MQSNCAETVPLVLPELPFDINADRDFIYTDREAVGANTTLGRHYSVYGEQIENFLKAKTPEQAMNLKAGMILSRDAIKALKRVRVAAPTLTLAGE